jgi:hypothetical protein
MQLSLKSLRQMAAGLLAGLLVLLTFVLIELGDRLPLLPDRTPRATPQYQSAPVDAIDRLFAPGALAGLVQSTTNANPFFTSFYQPAPVPPPSTRKVPLIYQGFYEAADGRRQAYVKAGEELVIAYLGAKIAGELAVAEIDARLLTLKDPAGKTNLLEFNVRKEVEVPAK